MKLVECFQKGLLKRKSPDMENADRSIKLSMENIEDAVENLAIHRYRVVDILDSYRRFRHDAIYGLDFVIDEKEARASLETSKEFLEKIKIFIGKRT